jgi:hypothetical protein
VSPRSLAATLVLALALPATALADDAPTFLMAGNGMLAAPFIPGGTLVSANYKAVGQPWLAVDLQADNPIIGISPLPFVDSRVFDDEVWNHPIMEFTATEACVFGGGDDGTGDGAPSTCWMESVSDGALMYAGRVLSYGLEADETVLAADAYMLPEVLGFMGLALVVETDDGNELRMQYYQESDWDFVQRVVVELPEGLGPELAVRAWAHDGVPRVMIMDDSTWWINADPVNYSGQNAWVRPCPSHVMCAVLPSTLRVTQLEGDTSGTQRISVQDDDQLVWAEFGNPDDMVCGAIDIPGPEGVVATELDADLGLYTLSWLKDAGEWGAALVGNGQIYGYASFGDVQAELSSSAAPSDLRDLDPTVIPDTWYAIGGNAFVDGDPDRPVIAGSTGVTVQASSDAALTLRAGPSGTTDRVMAAATAAGQLLVEEGDIGPTLEVTGSQALAIISGSDRRIDAETLYASYWNDPGNIPGLAHFTEQAEELLGTDMADALDAAVVVEPCSTSGNLSIQAISLSSPRLDVMSAVAVDGYQWKNGEFLVGANTTLSFSDFGGSGDQVDATAQAYSGYNGVDGSWGHEAMSSATVVLGDDDEGGWSIVSTDPDTPMYDSVRSAMYPLCGGYCYLSGVESTSLATRGEITATYTVSNIFAAGNAGSTLGYDSRSFVQWVSEKGGLSLTGEGELELAVYVIDVESGERELNTNTVYRFIPDVDDEVIVAVIDGDLDGLPSRLTVDPTDEVIGLELVYTLRSSDGGLVTLDNAVGFGFADDTDGDGLFDDDEYSVYGTDPLLADTDGDGVDDGDDPSPAVPGVGSDWLAQQAYALALAIECLDLSLVDAANDNAASGRVGSMATRASNAASSFEGGKINAATALLDGLLDRVDGADKPDDWIIDCDERVELAEAILELLELAAYE